jgi:Glu-tRNA(Gln) amidotransferase subunit E-like FAD-binding protein
MYPKEIAKRENIPLEKVEETLSKDVLVFVLEAFKKKKITKNDIKNVLDSIVKGASMEEAIKIEKVEVKDIEKQIIDIIKSKPGLSANAYMGLVMKEFKGKVSGKEVMEIIKKYVK